MPVCRDEAPMVLDGGMSRPKQLRGFWESSALGFRRTHTHGRRRQASLRAPDMPSGSIRVFSRGIGGGEHFLSPIRQKSRVIRAHRSLRITI